MHCIVGKVGSSVFGAWGMLGGTGEDNVATVASILIILFMSFKSPNFMKVQYCHWSTHLNVKL